MFFLLLCGRFMSGYRLRFSFIICGFEGGEKKVSKWLAKCQEKTRKKGKVILENGAAGPKPAAP
jgi:hypothetical protein